MRILSTKVHRFELSVIYYIWIKSSVTI